MSGKNWEETLAALDEAIRQNPENALAHFNRGLILLRLGRFEEGWREHRWRWRAPELGMRIKMPQPWWEGHDFAGQRLLLYYEQNLADTIQFVRYVTLVAALAARTSPK